MSTFVYNAALERLRQECVDQYIKLLKAHDWSHEFSDDGEVWARGRAELLVLREVQRNIDADYAIWNQHCPAQCRNGETYR